MSVDLDRFESDDELLIDLGSDIWLMDNHKWAVLVWDRFKSSSRPKPMTLVHVDYHWDGVNDFHRSSDTEIRMLTEADSTKLTELIQADEKIKCDSFIAPAVIRGIIRDIHFYCRQKDQRDVGLSETLLLKYGATQTIHKTARSLFAQSYAQPLILDFCLDLFNDSDMWGEGDLWPDDKILKFLNRMKKLVQSASLVTVSASFGFSGSDDDTRHLAKLVLPLFQEWRC